MKEMKIAGLGLGAIITLLGLVMISPIIDGWNIRGIIVTIIGLAGFGGFQKGKWY